MEKFFDEYTLRARIIPAFLVLLPVALAGFTWIPGAIAIPPIVLGTAIYGGLVFLLSQFVRDEGKRKEATLFKKWGGLPTTRCLRHRDTKLDVLTFDRYRRSLEKMFGLPFPSKTEEQRDEKGADELYESTAKALLEKTRDKSKFPLVFAENVNYGFRRNLWAMKPVAVFLCTGGTIAAIVKIGLPIYNNVGVPPEVLAVAVLDILLLSWWLVRITPNWVRAVADTYAQTLIACSELLAA